MKNIPHPAPEVPVCPAAYKHTNGIHHSVSVKIKMKQRADKKRKDFSDSLLLVNTIFYSVSPWNKRVRQECLPFLQKFSWNGLLEKQIDQLFNFSWNSSWKL